MLNLSGFSSQKALTRFLTEKKGGPTLTVDRLAYGNEGKGLDDEKGGTGSLGQMKVKKDNSSIILDRGIVDAVRNGIESEKTGSSVGAFSGANGFESPNISTTMAATLGFAGRILEHETVHFNLGSGQGIHKYSI
ncbi:MAG: hypothetical protein J0H74_30065 [Chitinophagaceae bacterium]|nr:hypothetical protein [Chitinophagaceae bacterium]